VNHARHGGARSGAEIGLVDQQKVNSLQRQLSQQADSVEAAAHDQNGDVGVLSKQVVFWAHSGSVTLRDDPGGLISISIREHKGKSERGGRKSGEDSGQAANCWAGIGF